MSTIEYAAKLTEVERLLNDPDTPMEPARVWSLLAELSENAALLPEKEGWRLTPTGQVKAEVPFVHTRHILWGDTDAARIVYTARIAHFAMKRSRLGSSNGSTQAGLR